LLHTAARGAAGAAIGTLGWRAFTAGAQDSAGNRIDLGNGVHLLTVEDTNVLAVTGADGVALVDGGSAAQSDRLLALVAALPQAPSVHTLFNTHWHPEQTGSNEALARAGATIVAHENTKLWLTTDVTWPWDDETVEPLSPGALPTKTFYGKEDLTLGGTAAQCGHLRDCPHTDGDMYVFFPQQNVLAVGDAITGAGWPSIDWWTGGWIGGIVGGIDMLFSVADDETRIVPARGPVLRRADLQTQYDMYSLIWERLVKTLYSGGGTKEALAAEPTKEFNDIMGEPDEFVVRAFQSLWAYLSPDA
jgi:glyoxylase-like metal-dependent hydrolase (beta-lactamase superfamily II)